MAKDRELVEKLISSKDKKKESSAEKSRNACENVPKEVGKSWVKLV